MLCLMCAMCAKVRVFIVWEFVPSVEVSEMKGIQSRSGQLVFCLCVHAPQMAFTGHYSPLCTGNELSHGSQCGRCDA